MEVQHDQVRSEQIVPVSAQSKMLYEYQTIY
jgi:hypothetical protein